LPLDFVHGCLEVLVFLGLGYSLRHLTSEALEELKTADVIYIDTYTSLYEDPYVKIAEINPRAECIYASRRDLEGPSVNKVLEKASTKKVVIAVPGDPFIATTHDAILIEALKRGIHVKIVNGISFITMAYSRLGLQSYRFGKHVTLVYPKFFKPYSTIEVIYDNLSRNLHTIVLLELNIEESKAMTIQEAVEILLELDYERKLRSALALGIARLGWRDEKICGGLLPDVRKYEYPPPPHSIIVLGKLSPIEEEFFEYWKKACSNKVS